MSKGRLGWMKSWVEWTSSWPLPRPNIWLSTIASMRVNAEKRPGSNGCLVKPVYGPKVDSSTKRKEQVFSRPSTERSHRRTISWTPGLSCKRREKSEKAEISWSCGYSISQLTWSFVGAGPGKFKSDSSGVPVYPPCTVTRASQAQAQGVPCSSY